MANLLQELKANQNQEDRALSSPQSTGGFSLLDEAKALQPKQQLEASEQNVINTSVGGVGDVPTDSVQPVTEQPKTTISEDVIGGIETAAAIGSSAISEPVAGLVGLVTAPFAGVNQAVSNIESIRELLTFSPRSDSSKAQLQAIGKAIEPVAEGVKAVESALGNSVLDATGSPELAAIAHSLPTAALELIGVKGLRGARLKNAKLSGNTAKAVTQAAPDIETINAAKTTAYKQLDDSGVKVKSQVYDKFADSLAERVKKEGIDPTLTPKSAATMKRIVDAKGEAKTLTELDTLRKIAKGAANDIDKTEARIGSIIIDEIDSGIDKLSNQIGGEFKGARSLAQRGFKSQAITDMIENASHTASGMENGLRIEARKLLKNKKKRRGFTGDEIAALKRIEQGTSAANTAKFLGKFGISEGQATSMLGASIGIGGGGAIGSAFGTGGAAIGALTVPLIGQIAKKTAQRITLKNTKFADDLVRSGKNANDVARAYLKHTPKSKRSVSDLTDILLDTSLSPNDIKKLPSSSSTTGKLVSDSIHFAEEIKRRTKQAASVAAITTPSNKEQ